MHTYMHAWMFAFPGPSAVDPASTHPTTTTYKGGGGHPPTQSLPPTGGRVWAWGGGGEGATLNSGSYIYIYNIYVYMACIAMYAQVYTVYNPHTTYTMWTCLFNYIHYVFVLHLGISISAFLMSVFSSIYIFVCR